MTDTLKKAIAGQKLSKQSKTWVLETDAAEYGFFHPDYGLVRGGAAASDVVKLKGAVLDDARRRAEDMSLCGSRRLRYSKTAPPGYKRRPAQDSA